MATERFPDHHERPSSAHSNNSLMRTSSSEGAVLLRHPTPDLQSLQGAYIGNVNKLEETAERMSESGSDLGEVIRTMSRQSSLRSNSIQHSPLEEPKLNIQTRPRNTSNSSYTNSIIDVNTSARMGGYSPGGFMTSPNASIRSGSWSFAPSVPRSTSKGSRSKLDEVSHAGEEDEHRMDDHSPATQAGLDDLSPLSQREPSVSSFTQRYDQIARDIEQQFEDAAIAGQEEEDKRRSAGMLQVHNGDGIDRPNSAASGDTFQQARSMFRDFDGVHYSPDDERHVSDHFNNSQGSRQSSGTLSHIRQLSGPGLQGMPPPEEGMRYYPAPVPRMLNLPKRLSQLPAAHVQAKRRTQVLDNLPPEARNSALWLKDPNFQSEDQSKTSGESAEGNRRSVNPRNSMMSLQQRHSIMSLDQRNSMMGLDNIPPQLRASMFFDHQAISQEVEIRGESAEATLEGILEASTNAPVHAFTDHPIAGPVGNEIYGKEAARRSTATLLQPESPKKEKRRSSLGFLLGRRGNSSSDLTKIQQRNSSRLSIGTQLSGHKLEQNAELQPSVEDERDETIGETTPLRHSVDGDDQHGEEHLEGEQVKEEDDEAPMPEEEPRLFGPPTTLLAELQVRKQQLRERNRTAATAYPNGMHSTLLELDAVAQIEKRKRQGQRVALAWEDPHAQPAVPEKDDDDIPLGMLFPRQKGTTKYDDWDRPLGLMEKREQEDNEPLSSRRNRLQGREPVRRRPSPAKGMPGAFPTTPAGVSPYLEEPNPMEHAEEEQREGESLAQRRQRLQDKQQLDDAIKDVSARPVSQAFSEELLGRLGEPKSPTREAPPAPSPANEEEETLGQRRARLRREAEAAAANGGLRQVSGNSANSQPNAQASAARPGLKQTRSMADILSAIPAGDQARKVSNDALVANLPAGSLLAQNEQDQARRRAQGLGLNYRASSYTLDKPLVAVQNPADPYGALNSRKSAFKGGLYNTGAGSAGLDMSPAAMTPLSMPASGYFPPQPMPQQQAAYNPYMSIPFNPMMKINPMMMAGHTPMAMPMYNPQMMTGMYGNGYAQGMQMGMGMQMAGQAPIDPERKRVIDQWRQSSAVAPGQHM